MAEVTDHYDGTVSLTQDHQAVELLRDGNMLRRVICCCDCGLVHLMSINAETGMAYFVSEHGPVAEELRVKAIAAGQDFSILRRLAEERAARLKAEGERDEAVERADIAEAKWCGLEARLRAVIEAADVALAFHENYPKCKCPLCSHYRRVRDAQASPEPEASHKFEPITGSLTSCCAVCGLPWSKHGGRDER